MEFYNTAEEFPAVSSSSRSEMSYDMIISFIFAREEDYFKDDNKMT
jgi:hypothetical protein